VRLKIVRPLRRVQVKLDAGSWILGTLDAEREVDGVWSGFVRYSADAGHVSYEWFEQSRIRGYVLGSARPE
jgi:hypothetical protein